MTQALVASLTAPNETSIVIGSPPSLDGVRGVAVLMVVAYHSWNSAGAPRYSLHLGNLLSVCFAGVDLFLS